MALDVDHVKMALEATIEAILLLWGNQMLQSGNVLLT
jgi:hypothetical protein